MPFNALVFSTSGSWDTTTLLNQGQQVEARAIYLHLKSNNIEGGGASEGVHIYASKALIPLPGQQEAIDLLVEQQRFEEAYALCTEEDLFPGSIEFLVNGSSFTVDWQDPTLNSLAMRFFMDGIDATEDIVEVNFEIDSISNHVHGWYSVITGRNAFSFESQQIVML